MISREQLIEKFNQFKFPQKPGNQAGLQEHLLYAYTLEVYKELEGIFKEQNKEKLAQNIQKYLQELWTKRINGTALAYTVIPESPIVDLLCDIALFAAQQLNEKSLKDKPVGVINLLMPTVNTATVNNCYPHLGAYIDYTEENDVVKVNNDINVRQILKTHVLGSDGLYLIPVSCLPELLANPSERFNPYYDGDNHDEKYSRLNEAEVARLCTHSKQAKALSEAYHEYQRAAHEPNNLLGRLNKLCDALYLNSVEVFGKESHASEDAYSAIFEFKLYYDQISQEGKWKIPERLSQEINMLFNVGDNNNREGEDLDGTFCIEVRRTRLKEAMDGHDAILANIALGEGQENSAVSGKKQRYENLKNQFKQEVNQPQEPGDSFSLSQALIERLKIDVSAIHIDLSSMETFFQFVQLPSDLIQVLTKDNKNVKNALSTLFKQKKHIFQFALKANVEQFRILVPFILDKVRDYVLFKLFKLCDTAHIIALCEAIRSKFKADNVNLREVIPHPRSGWLDGC